MTMGYENQAPPATVNNDAKRVPLMAEAQRRDIGAGARCNRLTRRSLLWALTAHQRSDEGATYASTQTLADEAGVAERTVRRCLAEFEAEGLLKRIGRRGFNTVWRIERTALEGLPLTVQPREARSAGTVNSVPPVRKFGPPGPTEERLEESYAKHIPPYPQGGGGEVASLIGFDEGGEAERPEPKPQPDRQAEPNPSNGRGSFPAGKYGRTGAPDLNPLTRIVILPQPEGFDELLSLWRSRDLHHKGGQSAPEPALRAYRRALRRGGDPAHILSAAREFLASPAAKRESGRFLPKLARWLREARWEAFAKPPTEAELAAEREREAQRQADRDAERQRQLEAQAQWAAENAARRAAQAEAERKRREAAEARRAEQDRLENTPEGLAELERRRAAHREQVRRMLGVAA